jgi:hypothetical protein
MEVRMIQRPHLGAPKEEVRAYYRKVAKACEELGVQHGRAFAIVNPERLAKDPMEERPAPAQLHSPTSKAAARSVAPRAGTQRWRVLGVLYRSAPLTREQIAEKANLSENTVRPRVCELIRDGYVFAPDLPPGRTKAGEAAEYLNLTEAGIDLMRGAA